MTGVRSHLIDLLDDQQITAMAGIFTKVLAHMRDLPLDGEDIR